MDTGTHFVVGIGLAGLSTIDPSVAANTHTFTAVLIGTVAASQAPDLDTLYRLRSNADYIRNHRGWSHSLPAIGIWSLAISGLLALIFPSASFSTLLFWVFTAVVVHVFSDLFNTYGTQAARPFSEKWIGWNIIHIFDPWIFAAHIIAISIWISGLMDPTVLFPWMYGLLIIYYLVRTGQRFLLMHKVKKQDRSKQPVDRFTLIPTFHFSVWHVVKKIADTYYTGEYRKGQLVWLDQVTIMEHPAIEASKKHPDIASLLYYSSYACPEIKIHSWGYEVRWTDVRYRYRNKYPFHGVILLDHDLEPMKSYVGWLNVEKLDRRLELQTDKNS